MSHNIRDISSIHFRTGISIESTFPSSDRKKKKLASIGNGSAGSCSSRTLRNMFCPHCAKEQCPRPNKMVLEYFTHWTSEQNKELWTTQNRHRPNWEFFRSLVVGCASAYALLCTSYIVLYTFGCDARCDRKHVRIHTVGDVIGLSLAAHSTKMLI